jgi:hypothetical protein
MLNQFKNFNTLDAIDSIVIATENLINHEETRFAPPVEEVWTVKSSNSYKTLLAIQERMLDLGKESLDEIESQKLFLAKAHQNLNILNEWHRLHELIIDYHKQFNQIIDDMQDFSKRDCKFLLDIYLNKLKAKKILKEFDFLQNPEYTLNRNLNFDEYADELKKIYKLFILQFKYVAENLMQDMQANVQIELRGARMSEYVNEILSVELDQQESLYRLLSSTNKVSFWTHIIYKLINEEKYFTDLRKVYDYYLDSNAFYIIYNSRTVNSSFCHYSKVISLNDIKQTLIKMATANKYPAEYLIALKNIAFEEFGKVYLMQKKLGATFNSMRGG